MEGETPRTLIRGVLQASHSTRSSHRQLRQTPLASTRNRESPRLSRSASQPVSSGNKVSSLVKRPAKGSLTSEPKRRRSVAATPSEAITPRTNIRAYLEAADTKTPAEPRETRSSRLRSHSAISDRKVKKLVASETQSRRTSRKSLSKSFPTPRESITPREAVKLYLKAADTVPQARRSSGKRSNIRYVDANLDESSEEKQEDSESAAADDEQSQDEERRPESGEESGEYRRDNIQSGDENMQSDREPDKFVDERAESGDENVESRDEHVESGDEHVESGDENVESRDEHVESGDKRVESRNEHVESRNEHVESGDEHLQHEGKYESSQEATTTSSQDELEVPQSPQEEQDLSQKETNSEDTQQKDNAINHNRMQSSLHADQSSYETVTGAKNKSAFEWGKLRTPVLPDTTTEKATPVVLGKPPLPPTQQKKPSNARKAPSKATQANKPTRSANPVTRLPSSLVSGIFRHFSALRVSKDAVDAVQVGSDAFFERVAADLTSYCKHTGRKTIEESDAELLMRRQGLVKSRESFHALIEKYLPMEYRQEIIPTAKSGNKVVPKEKT